MEDLINDCKSLRNQLKDYFERVERDIPYSHGTTEKILDLISDSESLLADAQSLMRKQHEANQATQPSA